MVECNNLSKTFLAKSQQTRALDGVSFAVGRGQIHGIVGANGAGKTTCLRIICGLLRPTAGEVIIGGSQGAALSRRLVGFVSPSAQPYDRLTPSEEISYVARLAGMNRRVAQEHTARILETLKLMDVAHRPTGSLSTGMRRKVAIARALVHNPEVLLFDEPSSNLDILSTRAIRELIIQARSSGKAVIVASHNATEADLLFDSVTILNYGKAIVTASMVALRTSYSSDNFEDILDRIMARRMS